MKSAWNNKTALVCGASSGLGFHLSLALASQGARVIMLARDLDRLNEAKAKIAERHADTELTVISGDLCDEAGARQVTEELQQRFGQLDLVISAIGESDRGSIEKLGIERMVSLVRINVGSGLHAIQYFGPLLKPTRGVIVLVGSLSSHFAPRFMGGYSIAKHGVAALAQQSRLELAADGVHVMLASPGPIARPDAGQRYSQTPQAAGLPAEALKSGGGAKVKGLDPAELAEEITVAAAKRRRTLVLPRKARLLLIVSAVSPKLGDYLLRKLTS